MFEASIVAFREALKEDTRERNPMQWARIQSNLGGAFRSLGDHHGDAAMLEASVTASREALKKYTHEREPMEWARTQNNLGNVLRSLGELRGDAAALEAAADALREALKERTRERVPMNWARTQDNLGNTLQSLGEIRHNTANLEASAAAYREALKERTREREPMEWARTQNNLGIALRSLGDHLRDAATLEASVAATREALKERTPETMPAFWAETQANLGGTLLSLGRLRGDAATFEDSIAAFREALKVYSQEGSPTSWAFTQHNLGSALELLGDLRDDPRLLQQAIDALRACNAIYDASDHERLRQDATVSLLHLLLRCRREAEAEALILPTLERSGAAIADAARSREGKLLAIAQVEQLYGLICHLRLSPDSGHAAPSCEAKAAALEAAEAGRARLLTEGRGGGGAAGGRQDLQALTADEILAAAPQGGAIVVPVLTNAGTYVLLARHGANEPDVVVLKALTRTAVADRLTGETGWLHGYYRHAHALNGRGGSDGSHDHEIETGTMFRANRTLGGWLGRLFGLTPPSAPAFPQSVPIAVPRDAGVSASGSKTAYGEWNDTVRATQDWLWRNLLGSIYAELKNIPGSRRAGCRLTAWSAEFDAAGRRRS